MTVVTSGISTACGDFHSVFGTRSGLVSTESEGGRVFKAMGQEDYRSPGFQKGLCEREVRDQEAGKTYLTLVKPRGNTTFFLVNPYHNTPESCTDMPILQIRKLRQRALL